MGEAGASRAGDAPAPQLLLDRDALRATVARLAREIAADHPDGVLLVGVLKGAVIFLSDLARAMHDVAPGLDVRVDFLAISRYAPDSGRVKILQDVQADLSGTDVVLVEDLVDTGLTLAYLLGHLRDRGARTVRCATLLDRPVRRIVPQAVDYIGVTIDDVFVLGYGLHTRDLYRNVDAVYVADRDRVVADPACYVGSVYGRPVS